MLSPSDDLQAIELTLSRLLVTKYINGLAFVLVVLEYFQTLELEVGQPWLRMCGGDKLSTVNVLFIVTRYLGFFANGLLMWFFGPSPSSGVEVCRKLYWVTLFSIAVTLTAADAIVCVRIHALAGRSRTMGIVLSLHFIATTAGFFCLLGLDIKTTTLGESPFPSLLTCFIVNRDHTRGIALLALMLYNTILACILSLWLTCRNYCSSKSPILRVFHLNGTFHFAIMSAVSSAHIILLTAGPVEFQLLLAGFHQAVHTTISARVLLFMREAAGRDIEMSYVLPPLTELESPTMTQTASLDGVYAQSVVHGPDIDSLAPRRSHSNTDV